MFGIAELVLQAWDRIGVLWGGTRRISFIGVCRDAAGKTLSGGVDAALPFPKAGSICKRAIDRRLGEMLVQEKRAEFLPPFFLSRVEGLLTSCDGGDAFLGAKANGVRNRSVKARFP